MYQIVEGHRQLKEVD